MTINLQGLYAEFERSLVSWRPQGNVSKNGTVMALAYIDARDVMDRLDNVCGPENWQDSYTETAKGRVLCTISIRTETGWVNKSDGAGETQVEGDKGGISDAFKRAAVKWGIGRYLYDIDSPWVRCETYVGHDGKPRFSKFTEDPWGKVRRAPRVFVLHPDEAAAAPPIQPISNLGGTGALKATLRASIAAETPHDPETGEIPTEAWGPLPQQETAKQWVDMVKDKLGPGATKRQLSAEYAAMLVAKIHSFKPHKGALVYVNQFEQTHAKYIDRLDGDLKRLVQDALAEARDRATNPQHDPAMFRDVGHVGAEFGLLPANDHHEFR